MKFLSCILLISLLVPQARAGGDEVNNGGGLAEHNLLYGLQKLDRYIEMCLVAESCRLSNDEEKILRRMRIELDQERSNPELLQFVSGSEKPGFFEIDGETKIAKTGLKAGTPIYFNTDLLYRHGPEGRLEAISVTEGLAFLVHELGHHQGVTDHTRLDLLGLKVAQMLRDSVYTTPLSPVSRDVNLVVINGQGMDSKPEVLLYVFDQVYDLSDGVWQTLNCPGVTLPFPKVPIGWRKPRGAFLHNVHWRRSQKDNGNFQIEADVTNFCGDSYRESNRDFTLNLGFRLQQTDKSWELAPYSVTLQQIYGPWWTFFLPF